MRKLALVAIMVGFTIWTRFILYGWEFKEEPINPLQSDIMKEAEQARAAYTVLDPMEQNLMETQNVLLAPVKQKEGMSDISVSLEQENVQTIPSLRTPPVQAIDIAKPVEFLEER